MALTRTLTGSEEGLEEREIQAEYLVVAFDCAQPLAPPARLWLDVPEVVLGRGTRRGWRRSGNVARLELPDAWISGEHARLRRRDGRWQLEDLGSKNGTVLHGERVAGVERLGDGDRIELGGTMLMFRALRHTGVAQDDLGVPAAADDAGVAATLHPPWSAELARLLRVARSPAPVLLLGATGTGKEVVARALHRASERQGPFVPVNCGAIARTLVESELFGAVKGAFSGAIDHREGLVRAADGGTLFLDEIAELPEVTQVALLRVLQEREVLPVGATRAVPVDLRVVAATHVDLAARVDDGAFRADLYSRITGYIARLPPLAERREDLGLLIAALLPRLCGERARRITLARTAARALFEHAWPFNVRELEQTLTSALAVCPGDVIGVGELPEWARGKAATPVVEEAVAPSSEERKRILEALDACAGNQTRAARTLGISRSTLATKLAIHRIKRPRK